MGPAALVRPSSTVSKAQILGRAGARMAALDEPAEIVAVAAAAARELSGYGSAAAALVDDRDELVVDHAEGPFGHVLAELGSEALAGIALDAHGPLRAAGAAATLVLPLAAAGEHLGYLLLAHPFAQPLDAEETELLELLAAQAAGSVRTARGMLALRDRAARDPLTGLGHHATFTADLPEMRAPEAPNGGLAILLADLDGFKEINDRLGHAAGDTILRRVALALHLAAPAGDVAYRIGGDEFAVLASVSGEQEALELGRSLAAAVQATVGVTLSIGVAFERDGEDDVELRERADAAVYAVKRAGRDGVALG